MNKIRKALALFLSAACIVTAVPFTALAEENVTEDSQQNTVAQESVNDVTVDNTIVSDDEATVYQNTYARAEENALESPALAITGYSNTAVSLYWTAVDGASGYKVCVFRSGGWTDYATTSSNKITVKGLITCGAYLFRVQAYKTVNGKTVYSDYSNEVYQVTRANKISNFKVTNVSENSITMTWKTEPRVTGYRIYKYNESTDSFTYYKTVPSGTTTFTDTGLQKGKTYKYEIIGYRMYRDKMYFGYGGVGTSAVTKSTVPTELKVTGYTNKAVSLSWNKVSGASGYRVQVFRSGGWTNYANTTSNKITVSGLITCGAYLFRVQSYSTAKGKTVYSGYSNEVYQVTRANKISNFKVTDITENSVTMTWNAEPRVTGYRIYKYNDSTKTFNYYKTVPSGTTTFTDTGLEKGKTYKYEIIGYRMYRDKMYFGYGGVGTSASTYSSAPTGLVVTGYTNKTVSLSWNKVSGASGYRVQVFRSGGWTNYANTTSNKITVSGLITCGAYLFRVQAYNTANGKTVYSGYSNEVYQVTRANKIGNFRVINTTDTSITLTWNAEPRVTGYRIYKYNASTDSFNYYKTVPSGTTTFTDTGLEKGKTYKYEIIGYRMYRDKMYFGYGGVGTSAVADSITSISVASGNISVGLGESSTVYVFNQDNQRITAGLTFTSSNSSIVAVNNDGTVTGKKIGKATITAKSANGKKTSFTVNVQNAPTGITVTVTSATIGIGEKSVDIGSSCVGGYSRTRKFSSSNPAVATVNGSGVVTGVSVGTANITCSTYNGKKAVCKITVKNAPTSIHVSNENVKVQYGSSKYVIKWTLSSGSASYGTTVTSSDTSIAKVTNGGTVTGVKCGTCNITIRCYNGVSKTMKIRVVNENNTLYLNRDATQICYEYSNACRYIFGKSSQGRNLESYVITPENGKFTKTYVMTFAIHGFEDAYAHDGKVLTAEANKLVEYYAKNPDKLGNFRLIIVPCLNPDGTIAGLNNLRACSTAFGRCTAAHVDMNRDFRNFKAQESVAMRNLLMKYRPDVFTDFHGWLDETIGTSALCTIFNRNLGLSDKQPNNYAVSSGYLYAYAYNAYNCPSVLVEYTSPNTVNHTKTYTAINEVIRYYK